MKEKDFRIMHSMIIEYYQLIEMRLKGICAAINMDGNKGWIERLDDYEEDPMGKLLIRIQKDQKQQGHEYIKIEEIHQLDKLRERRNYWCHQCFGGSENYLHIKRGEVLPDSLAQNIKTDLNEALSWDEKLTGILCNISDEKRIADHLVDIKQ
ncbi:MAG: hypothetical protein IK101_03860 [Oscillospiraceae bacterium]|nr:hypothetical protein [Oscillospiraceae bacterium]